MMTVTLSLADIIVFILLSFFFGFLFGYHRKKAGLMSKDAHNLSEKSYFTVIHTSERCTVLMENNPKKDHFLVSTKVFSGKPIRAKDIVRHVKDTKEMKALGIPVPVPYNVLVKEVVEQD